MLSIITCLCPVDFVVDNIAQTRCKKVNKGKCCWTGYYRSVVPNNIHDKKSFKDAAERITSNKPHMSIVVAFGRYGSANYGVYVTYSNIHCLCHLDFDCATTTFPLELKQGLIAVRESYINIDNYNRCDDDDEMDDQNEWLEMVRFFAAGSSGKM